MWVYMYVCMYAGIYDNDRTSGNYGSNVHFKVNVNEIGARRIYVTSSFSHLYFFKMTSVFLWTNESQTITLSVQGPSFYVRI